MPARNAIVIAVDGLRASALGAYGNTWHPTSAMDALASQSLVVEWMWCDSVGAEGFYRGAWQGRQAYGAVGDELVESPSLLPTLLAAAGIEVAVTTDDAATAGLADAAHVAEVQWIDIGGEGAAATVAHTALARLFAVGADQLQAWRAGAPATGAPPAGRMLWLDARGFHGLWDAPQELRETVLDEDDPPAPTFVDPPRAVEVRDQDELLLYRAAYAAQTMVLDECIGGLLAAVEDLGLADDTLVVLTGRRGFALGEHGIVGVECRQLYSEQLHVPCLIRLPEAATAPPRLSTLAQPVDLFATLCEWFGVDAPPARGGGASLLPSEASGGSGRRPFAASFGDGGEQALRTAVWMARRKPQGIVEDAGSADGAAEIELYVKPDDRWEANEVADRCPEVARRLLAALDGLALGQDPTVVDFLDDDLVLPAQ